MLQMGLHNQNTRFPKVILFLLSMAPFFVILGLMTMDIPICWDKDAHFIGWDNLWRNTRMGIVIILISMAVEYAIFYLFKHVCNSESGEQSEKVVWLKDRNYELVSFVTSVFLPLIGFQYNQLNHWIVTILIVILIGYIFCSSDCYFTNPTLAIFGYRLYDVQLDNQTGREGSIRNITVISKSKLKKNDIVRCYKLSENVNFARNVKR